jgi:predicted enzyme related to lactoylglutathione lyase
VSRCGCTPTTAQGLHDRLAAEGVPITVAPFDSPFGRTFTFTDPDGYAITIHDQP